MAEPMVRELMRADHVDPASFEALLRSVAARSLGRTGGPIAADGPGSPLKIGFPGP
jgi:hypothetical protein